MPLVAKRKLNQSWRDAVGARAGDRAPTLLARFEALVRDGSDEATAAYRVLDDATLLWRVDEPGAVRPAGKDADEVPAL